MLCIVFVIVFFLYVGVMLVDEFELMILEFDEFLFDFVFVVMFVMLNEVVSGLVGKLWLLLKIVKCV